MVGGIGMGAQLPCTFGDRAAHCFHRFSSARNLMNTPPTTARAWKPLCVPLSVKYQSVIGTRDGDSCRKVWIGSTSASKSSFRSARVAVQTIQSSFVYVLRESSGRPYLFCFVR